MPTEQILIVEDEPIVARDTENKLVKIGYTVLSIASSGEEAIQIASEEHPDLALMDIRLRGEVDGIQAANQIRSQANIPVIYMTALADEETLQRAKVTQPFGYIHKPIDINELRRTIEIALFNHAAEIRLQKQLQRLSATRSIDEAILSNHDLRQTLKVCLEEVINHLKVDAAAILLLNPFSQTLEYADGRGFHSVAFQQSCLIPEESLASRAFLLKETVHIPDLNTAGSAARLAWAEKLPWIAGEGFVAYLAMPLISKSETRGILEVFHRRALQPSADWLDFFNILGRQTAIAVDNAIMLQNMQSANMELVQAYHATIEGWSRALEFRDRETQGHSQRVTELSVKLARAMGVPEEELVHVRRGALLHDIGKMGIPDSILLKPGSLNDVEQALMRQHPLYAYEMLVPIPFLRTALEIPYCHHERWDGSGYPRGLKGDKIPLSARIFALVDVWDAICSDRPYNKAWPEDKALAYVQEQSGKLFDPSVVETFLLLQTSSLRSDHVIRMSEATRNP